MILSDHEDRQARRIAILWAAKIAYRTALSDRYNSKDWPHAGLEPYNPDRILMSGMLSNTSIEAQDPQEPPKKARRIKFNNQITRFLDLVFYPLVSCVMSLNFKNSQLSNKYIS